MLLWRARTRGVAVTADGCENLAPKWSGTPEDPAVVWPSWELRVVALREAPA